MVIPYQMKRTTFVLFHQLERYNMVKNNKKYQQYLYIIYQIRIWDFLFLRIFFRILSHFRHPVKIL